MKNHFLVLLILIFFSSVSYGQKDRYLTAEVAGVGGFYSLNYEKVFYDKEKLNLVFRAGISIIPYGSGNGVIAVFPIMVHGVFGEKSHKLDVGIGQALSLTLPVNGIFARMPLSIGYRYEREDKNHYWRIAYTPIVSYLIQFQWEHWAGITFGLKLKTKEK